MVDYDKLLDGMDKEDSIRDANRRLQMDPRTAHITVNSPASAALINEASDVVAAVPQLGAIEEANTQVRSSWDKSSLLDKASAPVKSGFFKWLGNQLFEGSMKLEQEAQRGVGTTYIENNLNEYGAPTWWGNGESEPVKWWNEGEIDPAKWESDFGKDASKMGAWATDPVKEAVQGATEANKFTAEPVDAMAREAFDNYRRYTRKSESLPVPDSVHDLENATKGQGFWDTPLTFVRHYIEHPESLWYQVGNSAGQFFVPAVATLATGAPGMLARATNVAKLQGLSNVFSKLAASEGLQTGNQLWSSFASSFGVEHADRVIAELKKRNVNVDDFDAVRDYVLNHPDEMQKIEDVANRRATGVAMWDAASFGLAGKSFSPITNTVSRGYHLGNLTLDIADITGGNVIREFRDVLALAAPHKMGLTGKVASTLENVLVSQPVIQGAMGMAGEASGSLLAGDPISNYDVWAEGFAEFGHAPVEAVTASIGVAKNHIVEQALAEEAGAFHNSMDQVNKAAAGLGLKVTDEHTLNQWAQEVGEDKEVYAFAQDLVDNGTAEKIREHNPLLANRIEAAAELKQDITIPVSDVLSVATKDEALANEIVKDARATIDGMSPRQAENFVKGEGRRKLTEDMERIIDDAAPDAETRRQASAETRILKQQLMDSGVSEEVASLQVLPWEAYMVKRAKMLGVSPKDIVSTLNLRVQGGQIQRGFYQGDIVPSRTEPRYDYIKLPDAPEKPVFVTADDLSGASQRELSFEQLIHGHIDMPLFTSSGRLKTGKSLEKAMVERDKRRAAIEKLMNIMSTPYQLHVALRHKGEPLIEYQQDIYAQIKNAEKEAGVELPDQNSPLSRAILTHVLVNEGRYAIKNNPTAIGWYDEKVRKMIAGAGLIFPELDPKNTNSTTPFDPNALFAFLYVVAVTSNGMKVNENLKSAVEIYDEYRKTGVMPVRNIGAQGEGIERALRDFEVFKDRFAGLDDMRKFFLTDWTMRQLSMMGFNATGEAPDFVAKGAALIGPKIGNGFFVNLNGIFDALTMDRWLIRTFARLNGTLIEYSPELFANSMDKFNAAVDKVVGQAKLDVSLEDIKNPKERKEAQLARDLIEQIKREMKFDMVAYSKLETKPELIDENGVAIRAKKGENPVANIEHFNRMQRIFSPSKYRDEYYKKFGDFGEKFRLPVAGVSRNQPSGRLSPNGPKDRAYIRSIFNDALEVLRQEKGLESLVMADLQASLWYSEKVIYENFQKKEEKIDYDEDSAPDYANAMRDIAVARGLKREDIEARYKEIQEDIDNEKQLARDGNADPRARRNQVDNLSPEDKLRLFRSLVFGTGRSKRQAGDQKQSQQSAAVYRGQAKSVGIPATLGSNRGDAGVLPTDDSRGSRRGVGRSLVLKSIKVWKSGSDLKRRLQENFNVKLETTKAKATAKGQTFDEERARSQANPAPHFLEFEQNEQTATVFSERLKAAKQSIGPRAACVEEKSMDELTGKDGSTFRFFLSEDGKSGFALKNGNDLVSVFGYRGDSAGDALVECAVAAGARCLDCFNTILVEFYAAHGFRPVAQVPFNDEFAPYDWDYNAFKKFNGGRPNIVFMVYDDSFDSAVTIKDLIRQTPVYTDYDEAQRVALEAAKELELKKVNKPLEDAVNGTSKEDPEPLNQGEGGRGSYSPLNARDARPGTGGIIRLMENADKSTFMHESAHAWLDMDTMLALDIADKYERGEELTEGQKAFLKNLGGFFQWGTQEGVLDFEITDDPESVIHAVRRWADMTLDEQRGMHELFAEGFEAYLLEGISPTPEMGKAFSRFKRWLLNIYREAVRQPKPISKDVRRLYDLMFATEQQADSKEQALGMSALFKPTNREQFMSPEEFEEYQALVDQAHDETTGLIAKAVGRVMRVFSKVRKAERERIIADYQKRVQNRAEEIAKEPRYQALNYLLNGNDGIPFYVTRESMEKAGYSKDVINTFDARGWLDNQAEPDAASITIEALAAMAGAPNNPEFVSELIDLESMDQATEEAVNQVNALVSQETGQPFSEYADYTADLAAHNQTRGMVLVAEHNALARKLGSTQILQSAARMRAQDIISNMPVSSLSPASYEAAERRNARDADEAFRRGKYAECLEAKRAQVLNHELARAALEAKDSYYRGSRMAMRAQRSKTLYKGYQFIIMKLLENHSVAQMTEEQRRMFNESGVTEDDRVNTIIDELREAGTPIEELSNYLYNTKHVRDMTVAEMEDFFMVIRQLEHLARAVQKQNLTRLAESVEQVVDEGRAQLEAAAKEQKRKEGKDNRVPITKKERAIDFLKNVFFLNHVKIQTWCRIFDRNKDGGFFWELFINSANKRAEFEAEYRAKISEGLRSILVPLFKKSVDEDPIRIAGFDRPFTHGMRLVVALNWGNASNRSRLQEGDPRFTTQAVNQILSTLTEEDWRAVERVWLLFESLRPMIAAKERRVFGIEPKWIEPSPFEVTTKEGKKLQIHGGYYPVKYDPRASSRADKNEAAESALDELKGAYQSTTTKRSFTKERVALVEDMPLRLDFVGIYEGFNDVIHDLAWHEWLIDTKRVLDGIPKLTDGLREDIRERYGYSVAKQIEEWRKDIALGGRMEGSDTARIVSALSRNIGMATMGYSATSAISQLTGIGYVLPRVGARALASGMRKWMANPSGLSEEVRSKSAFMAVRMNNQTKEIAEVRNMIEMGKINAIKAHAFDLLQFTQNIVDVIAWQSAYEKYTNAGVEEVRAIELADQTVIDTQSSGHISDLSKIERDKGIMRPLTIFYSWANAALNLIVAEVLGEHNKAKAAASLLWYCGVMNVFDHFFREMLRPGDDDDDDETKSIMRESLGSIVEFGLGLFVVTREVANAAGTTVAGGKAMAYNGPAGLRLASDAVNVIKDLGNDPFTETAFKHYLSIAGSMTGLPSVQINRTIKGMEAIAEGKVDGQIDSARALLFGYDGRVK